MQNPTVIFARLVFVLLRGVYKTQCTRVSDTIGHDRVLRLRQSPSQRYCSGITHRPSSGVSICINHPSSLACTSKDSSPPLRLSGRPANPCSVTNHNPHRKSLSYRTLEEDAREGRFHVRGYVPGIVSGVSTVPILRQGTKLCISNNNWEETLVNTI